jgi:hypothetical protein
LTSNILAAPGPAPSTRVKRTSIQAAIFFRFFEKERIPPFHGPDKSDPNVETLITSTGLHPVQEAGHHGKYEKGGLFSEIHRVIIQSGGKIFSV